MHRWIFIASWHILRPDDQRTLCGRWVQRAWVTERGQGPTCETCFRIADRQEKR